MFRIHQQMLNRYSIVMVLCNTRRPKRTLVYVCGMSSQNAAKTWRRFAVTLEMSQMAQRENTGGGHVID